MGSVATGAMQIRGDDRDVFSTGAISRLCSVAPRTVAKWIDSGKLVAIRLPGSRDRRVDRGDLIEFLRGADMKTALTRLQAKKSVVLLGYSSGVVEKGLKNEAIDFFKASSTYELGLLMTRFHPPVVVVDFPSIGSAEASLLPRVTTSHKLKVGFLALLPEDSNGKVQEVKQYGYQAVLVKPIDPVFVLECAVKLVGECSTSLRGAPLRVSGNGTVFNVGES